MRLQSQIEALKPESPNLRSLRDRALGALERGSLDELKSALDLLGEGMPSVGGAGEDNLTIAGAEAALGWICMLELRYANAAEHFRRAAKVLPASEEAQCRAYRDAQADALYRHGIGDGSARLCAMLRNCAASC